MLCWSQEIHGRKSDLLQLYPPGLQLEDAFVQCPLTLFLSVSSVFHLRRKLIFSNLHLLNCVSHFANLVSNDFVPPSGEDSSCPPRPVWSAASPSPDGLTKGDRLRIRVVVPEGRNQTVCALKATFSLRQSQLELGCVVGQLLLELKQLLLLGLPPVLHLLHLTQCGFLR